MSAAPDLLVRDGSIFDGLGNPPVKGTLVVKDGQVVAIRQDRIQAGPETEVVEAEGCWVTPGFVDMHTHYDAEIEVAPALSESLRHGITTVVVGSCSLSLAVGKNEDLADMFCRVEAVPRDIVLPILQRHRDWEDQVEYLEHLDRLPLGPNVASYCGHSTIRAHAMGLERSLTKGVRPTVDELATMQGLVEQALDTGYLGLSIMTLRWDKMDGDRFRSRPLPSTYAGWREYNTLLREVRRREKVFQAVPDVTTKADAVMFYLASMGIVRKPLKTTIISLMDTRADRWIARIVGSAATFVNALGANFRMQALPEVFDLWADGMDVVVFEEFGAGTAALHLQDQDERSKLIQDPAYRERFRKEWTNKLLPRVFHRDFNASEIVECPDASLIGKSFAQIAQERGQDVVEVFLDLVARYGNDVRWYTVVANDRPEVLRWIVSHPAAQIGFSDAGAHLRNMAHYNFPLRLLRMVVEAEEQGRPIMSIERAIERCTGELGQWYGLDAGVLAPGRRADLVVLDPAHLDERVHASHEAPIPEFQGLVRLVRRNPELVRAVAVNGRVAVRDGEVLPSVGTERGFGQVLRSGRRTRPTLRVERLAG
ncbi:MAG: N-acyl-D-glutamate amidohydrolase [Deltaproteobacteria bacterium]|nr:MAG: N-acyl-D-glutamate amidohydrolase [Deltaproteobacteria bacterium]